MRAKPHEILKAMNLLNDPFVEVVDRIDAKERAEAELEEIDAIESSDISAEEKCQKLYKLLGHEIPSVSAKVQCGTQSEAANYSDERATQLDLDLREIAYE